MSTLTDRTMPLMRDAFSKGYYDGSPPQISRMNVFHQTPSTSPIYLDPSTISSPFQDSDASMAYSRKRSRSTYNTESFVTPSSRNARYWPNSTYSSTMMGRPGDVDSPVPFVNTRYELAGGMDSQEDENEYNYGLDTREGIRKRGRQDDGYSVSYHLPNLPTDANGRLRPLNPPKGDGILSKVWEFCQSAFRGFTAGGGQSYLTEHMSEIEEVQNEKRYEDYLLDQNLTPVPGRFPQEEFDEEYIVRPPTLTPPRPAKRRQISNENGGDKWVMVPEANRSPRKNSALTRPMPRGPAPRRPILATRASTVSHAGSPALHPSQPASFASPRSPPSKLREPVASSPASIEAAKWAAKKRKEDQETDESIRRFNSRLKAMIKEGREALGTNIEIGDYFSEDHEMDEGNDEGFVSGGNGW